MHSEKRNQILIFSEFDSVFWFSSIFSSVEDILTHEENSYEITTYNEIPVEKHTITTFNGNTLSRQIEYMDSAGNVVARQTEYQPNQFYTDTYTYSDYELMVASSGDTIDSKEYFHDGKGRLIGIKDASGNTKQSAYDAFNRITEITDENGETTEYYYDSLDRIKNTQKLIEWNVEWINGRPVKRNYYSTVKREYDIYGNVVKVLSSNSKVGETVTYSQVNYTYDNNDQLIQVEQVIDADNS